MKDFNLIDSAVSTAFFVLSTICFIASTILAALPTLLFFGSIGQWPQHDSDAGSKPMPVDIAIMGVVVTHIYVTLGTVLVEGETFLFSMVVSTVRVMVGTSTLACMVWIVLGTWRMIEAFRRRRDVQSEEISG